MISNIESITSERVREHREISRPRTKTRKGRAAALIGAAGACRVAVEENQPPRVLLAEDNLEMRRFLADCLRKDGYEVIEAQTGMQLLDTLSTQLFHPASRPSVELVISDLRMPGLTGLEVLAGLRDSDWATPFILITAFGSEEVHNEALREGAAAVINKPFDIEELRTAVVNLIGRAKP